MTNTKHTPGPWLMHKRLGGMEISADANKIAWVPAFEHKDDAKIALPFIANARLIAAAPEQHKCLDVILAGINVLLAEGDTKTLERIFFTADAAQQWAIEARAAIAKAKGE